MLLSSTAPWYSLSFCAVGVVDLLEAILIALCRLIEEGIDFAFAQQLNQFGQSTVQDVILLLEFFRGLHVLTRIERNFFIGGVMLFRDRQHALRRSQQIGDGGTAADFVGIHHVTNTRSVQGITSLQQVDPAFVQFRLLLADRLQDGKVFLIAFQRGEKESARNQLQGAKQHQHQQQAGDHLHTI